MTNTQVEAMLRDTKLPPAGWTGNRADLACHVKALADERERLLGLLRKIYDAQDRPGPCFEEIGQVLRDSG